MQSLNYFKALSDITRIRIYNVLLSFELSVNELVALMDMGQSRISRHLKILTDSGLLRCRRNGVWAFYSAAAEQGVRTFSKAVRDLLDHEASLKPDLESAALILQQRSETTRQFFNTIAHKWDDLKGDILGDFDLNTTVVEKVGTVGCAVDLGCGTGELLSVLTGHAGRVIGVDSSSMMLAQARKRFSDNGGEADLRLGELEHLPLKDREADLAVISLALHHLSDPQAALKEAHRILSKQGVLIVAEFDRHDNEMLRKTYGDRWLGFSVDDMKTWFNHNGYVLQDVSTHDLNPSLRLNIFTCQKQ